MWFYLSAFSPFRCLTSSLFFTWFYLSAFFEFCGFTCLPFRLSAFSLFCGAKASGAVSAFSLFCFAFSLFESAKASGAVSACRTVIYSADTCSSVI